MRLKTEGFARLTALVEENGREFVAGQYELRYSEGESNEAIARSMGVPWFVLHRWLVENAPDAIDNAKAARTEVKIDRAEAAIEAADIETIGMEKAKADFALKLAGKRFRKEYGDNLTGNAGIGFGVGGITINISSVKSPYLVSGQESKVIEGVVTENVIPESVIPESVEI